MAGTIDRDEAEKHLQRGHPVVHEGRTISRAKDLPPAERGQAFTPTRHEDGNLNRAGMEQVIREGGSVMHGGAVITRVEDLPPEHVLAGGDAKKQEAVVASLDDQIAKLHAQRTQAAEALELAKAKAAEAPNDAGQPPDDGLEEFTVDELKAHAEARKIDLAGAHKKADIIEKIRNRGK